MKYYYVRTPYINGRISYAFFVKELEQKGFGDRVEYNPGGWQGNNDRIASPHLRFENSDDALAYALSIGEKVFEFIPYLDTD